MKQVSREMTPIGFNELYLLQNHYHAQFDYPIHFHPEYEINLVFSTSGKRFIGNSIEKYKNIDIALIGSNVMHAWTGESQQKNARVITLQFPRDFLGNKLIESSEMGSIRNLLDDSKHGVVFSGMSLLSLKKSIIRLTKTKGFNRIVDFLLLLDEMSKSKYRVVDNDPAFTTEKIVHRDIRILEICDYLKNNYQKKIRINGIADKMNMTASAFSHYFKKHTYRSFTDYLIDIRISRACQMLQGTDLSIAQVSERAGFNNISNFNKLFKIRKKTTPKEFRKVCSERQIKNL
jgi:AraC-like DNA-binding protein